MEPGLAARAAIEAGARALSVLERAAARGVFVRRHLAYGCEVRQRLDVYAPAGARNAPIAVFFYGGAWRTGEKRQAAFVGRALARLGFLVAIPDVRLAPEVQFPSFIEDAAAAVGWISRHARAFGGDAQRLLLIGHSAGAHTAAMLALDRRFLDAQSVTRRCVRGFVGLAGPYDFYPFPLKLCQEAFGAPDDPQATQPVSFARADAPPALLIAGARDRHVPPENTLSLHAALKAAGARSILRFDPDLAHFGPLLALSSLRRSGAGLRLDILAFAHTVGAGPDLSPAAPRLPSAPAFPATTAGRATPPGARRSAKAEQPPQW